MNITLYYFYITACGCKKYVTQIHKCFMISPFLCVLPLQSDRQRFPVWWVCPCFPLSEGFPNEPCGQMLRMVTFWPACWPWDELHLHSPPPTHTHTHTTCPTSHIHQSQQDDTERIKPILAYKRIQEGNVSFQHNQCTCFQLGKFLRLSIVCFNQSKAWVTWPLIMYIHIIWLYIFFYV